MQQEMTMEEIEAQFDGEWVLVGDPELDAYLEVVRGQLLCHNSNADEFHLASMKFRDGDYQGFASFYVGEIADGVRILL